MGSRNGDPQNFFPIVQPSTDVDTTTRQIFQSRTDDVPNFPYTETPVLPKELYVKGMTSKLGYQHVSGSDLIFVVKAPVLYRNKPPGVPLPMGLNRSAWTLVNGVWTRVEDNVAPPAQAERFEHWVERACFQWHSLDGKVIQPLTCSTQRTSEAAPLGTKRVSVDKPLGTPRVSAAEFQFMCGQQAPQLQFSTEPLFSDKALRPQFRSLADLTVPCGRVINTLLRLVHGGSHGTGFRTSRFATPSEQERAQVWEQTDIDDA